MHINMQILLFESVLEKSYFANTVHLIALPQFLGPACKITAESVQNWENWHFSLNFTTDNIYCFCKLAHMAGLNAFVKVGITLIIRPHHALVNTITSK